MTILADGWGPDACRAAVTVSFEGLAGGEAVVSPALAAVLDVLGARDLSATFFVAAEVAEQEPLALTMIANARHEVAALDAGAVAALEAGGWSVRGVLGTATQSVRYVAGPGEAIGVDDGVVRIPRDAAAAQLLSASGPQAWHAAAQVAVGRAVEARAHVTVPLSVGPLERGDAFSVFVEVLDLVGGLRRARRVWVPTLDELAAWWRDRPATRTRR